MIFSLPFPLLDSDPGAAGGGSPSAADVSMSSMVDSLLSAPDPTPAADSTPAPAAEPKVEATPETPAAEPKAEPSAEEPKVEPEAPKPQAEEDDEFRPDDDIDEKLADPAKPIDPLDLKSPRGQRIYRSYKEYKNIAEKLGQSLTADDAMKHFQAFTDNAAMEAEFTSDDPSQVENFAANWNAASPQAMGKLAGVLPEFLAKNNQDAYTAMAMPVIKRLVNARYQAAAREANPDLRQALMFVAQQLDWDVFGSYRQNPGEVSAAQANAPDALSEREQQLLQREQNIQRYEQDRHASNIKSWDEQTITAMNSALAADMEKVLQPLKATLAPHEYKAAYRDLNEAVTQLVNKDAEGKRLFDVQHNKALRTLSSEDRDALVQYFMARASRLVRQSVPAIVKEWGGKVQQTNAAAHQKLASGVAAGTSPSGGGAPVPQSIAPVRKFGSMSEKRDAMIDELLGSKR